MSTHRKNRLRLRDFAGLEDDPSHSIAPSNAQESSGVDNQAQNDLMNDVQWVSILNPSSINDTDTSAQADLGVARMEISTRDHPENLGDIDLDNIKRQRRSNQKGTAESRAAPEVKEKLSAWDSESDLISSSSATLISARCTRNFARRWHRK